MELEVKQRSVQKKSEVNKLRREGTVPAILYSSGKEGTPLVVSGVEFKKALNTMKQGSLPTTVFYLMFDGKRIPALVKDIQYNITTYDVIHLDFLELIEDRTVDVNVPIECIGAVDCVGVKLGGVLRLVIRYVKVRCKSPKHIPACIEIDVRDLEINEAKKISDITLPEDVHSLVPLSTIAVQIVKR